MFFFLCSVFVFKHLFSHTSFACPIFDANLLFIDVLLNKTIIIFFHLFMLQNDILLNINLYSYKKKENTTKQSCRWLKSYRSGYQNLRSYLPVSGFHLHHDGITISFGWICKGWMVLWNVIIWCYREKYFKTKSSKKKFFWFDFLTCLYSSLTNFVPHFPWGYRTTEPWFAVCPMTAIEWCCLSVI